MAAFVSGVSDSAASMMLEDDRFLLHCDDLWQSMVSEHQFFQQIPVQMWRWLVELVPGGLEFSHLQSGAVLGGLRSLGYNFRDSFADLRHHPLSLTQGDLAQNIEDLMAMRFADITDDVARSVRLALESSVPKQHMIDLLTLVRQTPCATNLVEQGHGSGAHIMKAHSLYGATTLQARSSIHQTRAAFGQTDVAKALQRMDADIEAHEQKLHALRCKRAEMVQEARAASSESHGLKNTVASFALAADEYSDFEEALQEVRTTMSFHDLQHDWGSSPQAPDEDLLDALRGDDKLVVERLPEWMRLLIYNRDDFWGCAVFAGDPATSGETAFMPVLCLQSPLCIVWFRLTCEASAEEHIADGSPFTQNVAFQDFWHRFTYDDYVFTMDTDVPMADSDGLWVWDDLRVDRHKFITDKDLVPWIDFTMHMTLKQQKAESTTRREPRLSKKCRI